MPYNIARPCRASRTAKHLEEWTGLGSRYRVRCASRMERGERYHSPIVNDPLQEADAICVRGSLARN